MRTRRSGLTWMMETATNGLWLISFGVGAEVTVSEFREFLQQKLPAYMIPSFS